MQTEAEMDILDQRGQEIYDQRLKTMLEPTHNGEAVAIHVDSGEYLIDRNWAVATRRLRQQIPGGYIYTLFIGPPTPTENMLAQRFATGRK